MPFHFTTVGILTMYDRLAIVQRPRLLLQPESALLQNAEAELNGSIWYLPVLLLSPGLREAK
jgi:hypothetical protein